MELTYKQLETTLAAHLQIKPDRLSTFRSRIKQLQRLEFPTGVNVGRGAKMAYSAANLFQLITAFELINMGLPADRATKLVTAHWQEFSASYALAQRNILSMHFRKSVYARLMIKSLAEIQFFPTGEPEPSRVVVEDHEHFSSIFESNSSRSVYCYAVLCSSDLTWRVLKIAQDVGGVFNAPYDDEILEWLPSGECDWLFLLGDYSKVSVERARRELDAIHGRDSEVAERIINQNVQERTDDGDD